MEEKMKLDIKNIGFMSLRLIIFAIIIRILLPISTMSLLAIAIFMIMLELTLLILEQDSAIKRNFSRIKIFVVGITLYLGLRIIFGYILDMPLVDAINATNKIGFFNFPVSEKFPESIILEIAFMLPALGLACWFVKGGNKTKSFLWVVSFVLFILVLWQIKKPDHNFAMQRFANAAIGHHTSMLDMKSFIKETETATTWVGLGDVPINAVYDIEYNSEGGIKLLKTIQYFNSKPIYDILKSHAVVQMANPEQRPIIYEGQNFVQIKLPDETGNFVHSKKVWIPASYVTLEKGWPKGTKGPLKQKDYIKCDLGPSPSFILKPKEYSPYLKCQYGTTRLYQSKYGKYQICFRNDRCYSPDKIPSHSLSDFRFQGITDCDVRAFFEL